MVTYERLYIRFKGRVLGPLTGEKVLELIKRGQITKQHEISADSTEWKKAEEYPDLFRTETSSKKQLDEIVPMGKDSRSDASPQGVLWYANLDGANEGPHPEARVREWAMDGKVHEDTLLWHAGMTDWQSAAVLRPQWFQRSTGRVASATKENVQTEEQGESVAFTIAILRSHGWVLFLAITALVIGTFWAIGSIGSFFLIATRDGGGPAKAGAILGASLQVAFSVAWLFGAGLLLNYANRVSVLRYRNEASDRLAAMIALNKFWTYSGILVLIFLLAIGFLVVTLMAIGLSFPFAATQGI